MKTINERLEVYKHYTQKELLLAMVETEELMEQISKATTLDRVQELARAWLLVLGSEQCGQRMTGDTKRESVAKGQSTTEVEDDCQHKEWISHPPGCVPLSWKCTGCGITMTAGEMLIYGKLLSTT